MKINILHSRLSKVTRKVINKSYPDLEEEIYKNRFNKFWRFFKSKKGFLIITPLTLLLYVIAYIIDNKLSFVILDRQDALSYMENRIANIAVMISVTLVVIGFLFNNANYRSRYTLEIIFMRFKLFPIVYFSLSSVSIMILVVLYNRMFSDVSIVNFAVCSNYLTITFLMILGYLITSIILFTDKRIIRKEIMKELIREAKKLRYLELISLSSSLILQKKLNVKHPNKKINFVRDPLVTLEYSTDYLIKDVDIHLLNKEIKKIKEEKINVISITIGGIQPTRSIVWSPENDIQKKEMNSGIIDIFDRRKNNYRKDSIDFFKEKFRESINKEDLSEMKFCLDGFRELYQIKSKYEPTK